MIHSCGRITEIISDLIECGLDIFNPFQPEVMDVFEVKKEYGDRLSFYGGISTQKKLCPLERFSRSKMKSNN